MIADVTTPSGFARHPSEGGEFALAAHLSGFARHPSEGGEFALAAHLSGFACHPSEGGEFALAAHFLDSPPPEGCPEGVGW
jgi:hypothetical protein